MEELEILVYTRQGVYIGFTDSDGWVEKYV